MSEDPDDLEGGGYDVEDWSRLKPFAGRVATLEDVQGHAAVFALGETSGARTIEMELPQPVIWWSDDEGEQAAVAIQAEAHETEEGETMEVVGLILPDGAGAVALLDDVDLVDESDPVWRRLVTDVIGDETGED
jgi:hypothetical protein